MHPRPRTLSRRRTLLIVALPTLALVASGCARPLPGRSLDPVELAHHGVAAPTGPLSFEDAVRLALDHSPELQALRLSIQGAGGWPPPEPLGMSAGADSDGRPEVGLELDLLSVFGLGPQRAERVLARLRRSEAALALQARAREVVAELAEAYAVEGVLATPPPSVTLLDPNAFIGAGLAPAAAATAVAGARASLAAEGQAREAARAAARLRVQRHLGLTPGAALLLAPPPADWPPVPPADPRAALAAEPDVQRRVGAYEVARGEALSAEALRDPGLVLRPELALDPAHFFGAVTLRLPLGSGPAIRAAYARMEAARLQVRAEVLVALERAERARLTWSAAQGLAAASGARLSASLALADAERVRVEAEGAGFTEAVLAANAVVEAQRDLREFSIALVEARVRAAVAAGWPSTTAATPPSPPSTSICPGSFPAPWSKSP